MTRAYYRSTYVFVSRQSSPLEHMSLDDARLKTLKIGVQMIGNDATNTPPAHAIASRGITDNVRGYMLYGDYSRPSPSAAIARAVERGGPGCRLGVGTARRLFREPLGDSATPRTRDPANDPRWPMTFEIAMGVRRSDAALRDRINGILDREKPAINAILRAYHIPRVADSS